MNKFLISILLTLFLVSAKLPDIKPRDAAFKTKELLKAHASYKEITPQLMQRAILNYLDILDPSKSYFILPEINQWLSCDENFLNSSCQKYLKNDFAVFYDIHRSFESAIERRSQIDAAIANKKLPLTKVDAKEFKDLDWVKTEEELKERLLKIKALQAHSLNKFDDEVQEKAKLRLAKARKNVEEEATTTDLSEKEKLILANILKAFAAALDSHSTYFTPAEATQFMIDVQHRLYGIGAQLRDDFEGITIIKLIEGGPAASSKEIQENDLIIAVDGEPVIGMDIKSAVELIRGKENTPVKLTLVRKKQNDEGQKEEKRFDVTLIRREVVIKDMRFDSYFEPFADGGIGYLKLFSFYEDPDTSSSQDIKEAILKFKKERNLTGVVLDLRYNAGGLLSQAVEVAGLFMSNGVVVSIKDGDGLIQHLRTFDNKKIWDGPLIILVSKMSASASEIVSQTLQDYGRALVVGDEHTFGKGSFQTFSLSTNSQDKVNPEGEFKITRGCYYTVSGKTPQLVGVKSDICVPGSLNWRDVGEKFSKYPLENDEIPAKFEDDLADVSEGKRIFIEEEYQAKHQQKLHFLDKLIAKLAKNSEERLKNNPTYQSMIEIFQSQDDEKLQILSDQEFLPDLQLSETFNVMRDLIVLQPS